jgi:hypothetical protein
MEPATRNMPVTIIEEECYEDLHLPLSTCPRLQQRHLATARSWSRTSRGRLIAYNRRVFSQQVPRGTSSRRPQAPRRTVLLSRRRRMWRCATCPAPRGTLRAVHMVRPGSPSTFKPPAHCLDCVLGVSSQDCSFRHITIRSRKVCRSTDYTRQSTDCTSFTTDCYDELPVKNVLPDVAVLPEDKTEVGLHACQLQPELGGPD